MAFNETYKRDVIDNTTDSLGLNPATDVIPKQVLPTIQPVFEVKRRVCNIVRSATATNATSATLYTTPSNQDFYLIGATLGAFKDATSTSTFSALQVTIDGTARNLLLLPTLNGASAEPFLSISTNPNAPIKVDRNTTINVINDTNAAEIRASATIMGYTESAGNQLSV